MMIAQQRSALLKLVGAGVIFASVQSQHFQYDRAKREMDGLTEAISDQALIDKGALINQTSMYVLYADTPVPEREHLLASHAQLSALKLFQGFSSFASQVVGIDQEVKDQDLATLQRAVGAVDDVRTLSDYMSLHGQISAKYERALKDQFKRLKWQLGAFDWLYVCLNVIGALLIGYANWIDFKLAGAAKGTPKEQYDKARAAKAAKA